MFYQMRSMSASLWNSAPIAAPWRQELCGSLTAVVVLAAVWLPTLVARPDVKNDAPPTRERSESPRKPSMSSRMVAFSVARPDPSPTDVPQALARETPVDSGPDPSSFRMADGEAFPLVINMPAGPAWREVFRRYGGAIGVSNSSSPRPAYLDHTISPDGRVDEEAVPTVGRFLFRLSDDAIRVVNDTLEPAAQIRRGQSAFAVFAGPFRSVVACVLQEFCTTEHVNPDDLAGVQLELGPGFGLRVASTTRRAGKF
jgi:hypothetical protein